MNVAFLVRCHLKIKQSPYFSYIQAIRGQSDTRRKQDQ